MVKLPDKNHKYCMKAQYMDSTRMPMVQAHLVTHGGVELAQNGQHSDSTTRGLMSGKFMGRDAVISTIKSAERTNAMQKRSGTNHPVRAVVCGCSDPHCGAFHRLVKDRTLPTREEADAILKTIKLERRSARGPDGVD
ncbi:hypothetical protein AVHY2522_24820 [Acidovorax sp. SUPP2522]|uniref:hypothetical protein n=1 Tax=unclassified Acidovorax TaxID=2684926 RepID=UPI00234B60C8|nr:MULTISPECIES: hypothetical protein [unclassified Acidovorax]WCM95496.1 hypothetical protein M5C96_13420 [Acidovorax sp. GBBC 1281]GKT20114.1 hypothetical protein AVHY2522_24820 [Acidovorax sp. SUPP2522]